MKALELPVLAIERHRLDNGLRVVLQPDRSLPLVAVNLWYHVGSKDERPGRTGLAHLFEHMLFQGSEHVGTNDHFRLVQQAGGVANGSTWYDRTNYYETLPAHFLELALWLESDRMGYLLPALDGAKLEKQRSVVLNERRERVDNQPYGRALERIHELLYPDDHPYHWPVIGYSEDITAATLRDVETFFATYYTPRNAVLSLAGDFEPCHALERIDRYFGSIPAGSEVVKITGGPISPPAVRREVVPDRVELSRLYVAAAIPPFGDPQWYAGDLLATALGSGKTSPLYRELVYSRQLATDVSAFVFPTELTATFMVVATARPGVPIEELERVVDRQLCAVAEEGPSPADLERALNTVLTALCDEYQKLDERADLLSMFTCYFDEPDRIGQQVTAYQQLRASDLSRVAAECLKVERRVTVVVEPQGE